MAVFEIAPKSLKRQRRERLDPDFVATVLATARPRTNTLRDEFVSGYQSDLKHKRAAPRLRGGVVESVTIFFKVIESAKIASPETRLATSRRWLNFSLTATGFHL